METLKDRRQDNQVSVYLKSKLREERMQTLKDRRKDIQVSVYLKRKLREENMISIKIEEFESNSRLMF